MWLNFEVPDETLCISMNVVWNVWPGMKMANIVVPTDKLVDGAEFHIPQDILQDKESI